MKARYVCTATTTLIILVTCQNHNTIFFLIFILINLLYPSINFPFLLFLSELVHDTDMIVICHCVQVGSIPVSHSQILAQSLATS